VVGGGIFRVCFLAGDGGFELVEDGVDVHLPFTGGCFPDDGFLVVILEVFDFSAGEDDGGVVFVAHEAADFGEGHGGMFSCEVHGDRACEADGAGFFGGMDVGGSDAEEGGDGGFDIGEVDDGVGSSDMVFEGFSGEGVSDGAIGEGGVGDDFEQGAFEFADVGTEVFGDVFDDGSGEAFVHFGGALSEDGAACFAVWGVDFDDHAGDKAVDERFGELSDHFGVCIGGHDDLFVGGVDGVEGV